CDYRVLGATGVEEARHIMARDEVHMVLANKCMPGTCGIEFLKTVKQSHPDTVRLLFTEVADQHTATNSVNEDDVFRYVVKPFEPKELKAILRQAGDYYDLQAERKRLIGAVEEKNQQLEKVRDELRRANDLKKVFIRVASHELRTPLTVILGLAELAAGSVH